MSDPGVVLVTGASSGNGRATAMLLAQRGYRVFGTSRQPAQSPPVPGVELLELDVRSDECWPDFQRDIETLSAFLSEPISGREVRVEPGPGEPLLKGWVILGRRGETERVALALAWDAGAQALVIRGIDMREARRRWPELPEWVRSSLTNQGARLGCDEQLSSDRSSSRRLYPRCY